MNAATIRVAHGIALPPETERRLLTALGPGHALVNRPLVEYRDPARLGELDGPIFVPLSAWEQLQASRPAVTALLRGRERVLLLDKPAAPETVEAVLSQGFLAALPIAAPAEKIRAALAKAKESETIYQEISDLVGTVISERKTVTEQRDRLAFLHHVLARASATMDSERILSGLIEDLSEHYPVSEILAAFWRQDNGVAAEIYVPAGLEAGQEAARGDYLLSLAAKALGHAPADYLVSRVDGLSRPVAGDQIPPGRAMLVDLEQGGEIFGCLAILIHQDLPLENRNFLRAVIRQLSPAFRNALAYRGLKYRADRDGLTRLPNRQAFDERLAQETERQRRYGGKLSFLLVDIDHFKRINDTYGHQAGDQVLRELAEVLGQTLRSPDFAARYGGEEFAVILPGADAASAWLLAERLRARVARRLFEHAGQSIKVTLSVGLACSDPADPIDAHELIRRADSALYAAKNGGRNAVVHYEGDGAELESGLAANAG